VPANSIAVGVPARILPRRRAGQAKLAQRTG
jgi:acetyltransferase-like isoleucine patch superfamily enzyme